MHILFLTDNFPPEVNAPASRTFEHCREWVKAGHSVTVITCVPNFPKGEVFRGYKNKLWQLENREDIRVIRVWSYITANEGFIKRTLDYLSYMVTATLASPFVRNVDLVVGTSPQFFTACAAYVVSRLRQIPFVFELRDLWPESIKAVGVMKDGLLLRVLERLELFLYRKSAAIISLTFAFKNNLIRRGIDPHKIKVVTNGVTLAHFRPSPKDAELVERMGLQGKFVAGYIGTHGLAHALETILSAAEKMRYIEGGEEFRFIFLGDGAAKQALRAQSRALELDNVIFIDTVPKEEVARYWSLLDVSIIHLKKDPLFTMVVPSKLFESMGMGLPVLHGVAGESAEIVNKDGVGVLFEPENVDELMNQLIRLKNDRSRYRQLQASCLEAASKYDREVLAKRMLTQLEGLVQSKKAPGASKVKNAAGGVENEDH